jgi:serine/threonine protein phosphatase PrpC
MVDRWYYMHGGKTLGPVSADRLRQLAHGGGLDATDLIWPEGRQQSEAVEAQSAIDFSSPPPAAVENRPGWLDDIRTAAKTETKSPPPIKPDWLDDVRTAETHEQAFLPLEWDADNLQLEEEPAAKKPADELEAFLNLMPKREPTPSSAAKPTVETSPASRRLIVGSATTRGRVRDHNEDSLLVQQIAWSNLDQRHEMALVVVADGMGGHAAGEKASALVVRALSEVVTPLLTAAMSDPALAAAHDPNDVLDRGLREANRLVRDTAKDNPALKGMGSTAAAVLIWDDRVYIQSVGDCRVYHWCAGALRQVTRDQTLVARMVELGQLTREEAAVHPRRNEVAQAVGKYALLEPGRYELTLKPGDWLLACSDGLQAHVSDETVGELIAKAGASATDLVERLIDSANRGGGTDNCTVVAVYRG